MACYPVSEGRFLLNFRIAAGKGLLGRNKLKQFALSPVSSQKAEDLIAMFASRSSEDIAERLSTEALIAGGIAG
jgi:hypothetical protein